jgi:hypothetical protein
MKRGGEAFVVEQVRVVLKMSRLALKRAVKIRWLDSRRNPTIVLVRLAEYCGCCTTGVSKRGDNP